MNFLKDNERVIIYIPANSLKSAAPARACRSLCLGNGVPWKPQLLTLKLMHGKPGRAGPTRRRGEVQAEQVMKENKGSRVSTRRLLVLAALRTMSARKTLDGPVSAVSKPILVTKYSFCSIFQDLQKLYTFAPLNIFFSKDENLGL